MSDVDYKLAMRVVLNSIVRCHFAGEENGSLIEWDWEISDDEMDSVIKNQEGYNRDFNEVISDYYFIDNDSGRLIDTGYMAFDREAYFKEEKSAVSWVNAKGYSFKSWDEIEAASDRFEIQDCWFIENGFRKND